jgi:hypothetical protein
MDDVRLKWLTLHSTIVATQPMVGHKHRVYRFAAMVGARFRGQVRCGMQRARTSELIRFTTAASEPLRRRPRASSRSTRSKPVRRLRALHRCDRALEQCGNSGLSSVFR